MVFNLKLSNTLYTGDNAKLAVLIVCKLQEYKMHIAFRDKSRIAIPVAWINQAIEIYALKNLVTVFDLAVC